MAHHKMMKPGVYKLRYTIDQNAWFVKAGAIIPLAGKGIQNLQEPSDELRILIAPGAGKNSIRHYEDDGVSQAYPSQFATTVISKKATGSGLTVEVGARQGSYKGMSGTRKLGLVLPGLSRCPKATMAGQPLQCSYDSDTKQAYIDIPEGPADEACTVTVKF